MRRFGISAPRHHYLDGYNGWQLVQGQDVPFDLEGIRLPSGRLPAVALLRPVRDPTPPRGLAFDPGGRPLAARDGEPGLCDLPGCEGPDACLAPALDTRITGLALDRRGRLYVAAPDAGELRALRLAPPGELGRAPIDGVLSVAAHGDHVHVLARGTAAGTATESTSAARSIHRSADADAIAASRSGALAAVSSRGDFIDLRAAGGVSFQRIALGRRTLPAIVFGAPDATGAEILHVGDQQSGRVVKYRIVAAAGVAPVAVPVAWSSALGSWAALAWRGDALFALDDGCAVTPIDLEEGGFFAGELDVYLGPLDGGEARTEWHRVVGGVDLPADAFVLVSALASDDCEAFQLDATGGVDTRWSGWGELVAPAAGRPAELALRGAVGRYLFLHLKLQGDGRVTPRVHWLRVEYPRDSYLRYLPSIYAEDPGGRDLTARLLSLFQAENVDLARGIADLRRLFEPLAGDPDFFPWLAERIGLLFDASWPIEKQRRVLAEALTRYRSRGTRAAFEWFLDVYVGPGCRLVEGFRGRANFIAGPTAVLGCNTVLPGGCAPPRAQLDRGVRLGRARLDSGPYPAADPLVEHRGEILVYLPPALSDAASIARAERVAALEAPAGTEARVVAVRPSLHLGRLARLGIDASLGRRASLWLPREEGQGAPLPLLVSREPGAGTGVQIGVGSRLGMGSTL